jgi:hypothetical protein
MLVETKLPPWRVAIAALTLGYVAANLLRLMAGPEDRWSSHGFGISLLIGVPLLWILVVRRTSARRAKAAGGATDVTESHEKP